MFFTGGPIFGGAKPVPINTSRLKGGAWGMALVGIAGPLTNFLLALITFLIGHFTGAFYGTESIGSILMYVVSINLGFFVFNMIPIPPLDGSRVLYAIAPDGARDFMEKVERGLGIWLVFGLILIFSSALSSLMVNAINGILHFLFMMYFHLLFNSHYAKIAKKMFCNRLKWIAFINIPTCILSILPCKFPQIIFFLANIILLIHTWRKFRKNNSQKHTANA